MTHSASSTQAIRDFLAHGGGMPDPQWPGGAPLDLNITLDFARGGAHSIRAADPHSQNVLPDIEFPWLEGFPSLPVPSDFDFGSCRAV